MTKGRAVRLDSLKPLTIFGYNGERYLLTGGSRWFPRSISNTKTSVNMLYAVNVDTGDLELIRNNKKVEVLHARIKVV